MALLACTTGLRKVDQSQAHGTNHAGIASISAIVELGNFERVDVYSEQASIAALRGIDGSGMLLPTAERTQCRLFDITDLYYSSEVYEALYSAGGGLIEDRAIYALRPFESYAPVVCEIDCSHSRNQWNNIFLSTILGQRRSADGLIFKSRATQRLFHRVFQDWSARFSLSANAGESIVSPNPVSCRDNRHKPELRSKIRQMLGILSEQLVYLCFSRIERLTKGDTPSILTAWSKVVETCPTVLLIIAGFAWDRDYIFEMRTLMRELKISNNVVLIPNPYEWISDARTALMSAADVFLHLSTGPEESAPLTVLEAMAHGLPCIVAEWSGMPEQISNGRTGITVPVLWSPVPETLEDAFYGCNWQRSNREACQFVAVDPTHLYEAIVALVRNETLRKSLGQAALRFVTIERSPDIIARQRVEFIYEMSQRARTDGGSSRRGRHLVRCTDVLAALADTAPLSATTLLTGAANHDAIKLEYWLPQRFLPLAEEILRLTAAGKRLTVQAIVQSIIMSDEPVQPFEASYGEQSEASLHIQLVILRLLASGFLLRASPLIA